LPQANVTVCDWPMALKASEGNALTKHSAGEGVGVAVGAGVPVVTGWGVAVGVGVGVVLGGSVGVGVGVGGRKGAMHAEG
jgi:hypothetical protein